MPKNASSLPAPKQVDLYRLDLGKGQWVKFYRPSELTAGRQRELSVLSVYMMPKMQAAARARTVTIDGEVAADDPMLLEGLAALSRKDVAEMVEMQELAAATYIKAWNLKSPDGQIRPLPNDESGMPDVAGILDLPQPVYTQLIGRAAQLLLATEKDEQSFTVDGAEDETSPTGDSGI